MYNDDQTKLIFALSKIKNFFLEKIENNICFQIPYFYKFRKFRSVFYRNLKIFFISELSVSKNFFYRQFKKKIFKKSEKIFN